MDDTTLGSIYHKIKTEDISTDTKASIVLEERTLIQQDNISEKEIFIKTAVENVMSIYWPEPASEYYCRLCNYCEFESGESLRKHKESDEHKLRTINEKHAFCLICQVHTCNKEIMVKHIQGERHRKLKEIFEETEAQAEVFWQARDKLDLSDDHNQSNDAVEEPETFEFDILRSIKFGNLKENFKLYSAQFKSDIDTATLKLQNFFESRYTWTGVLDPYFSDIAIRHSMEYLYPQMKTKFCCVTCNYMVFKDAKTKNEHLQTESHIAYNCAKQLYFCKVCRRNHLTDELYQAHLDSVEHKKLSCVFYACRAEVEEILANAKKQPINYETVREKLHPPQGFVINKAFCLLCTKDFGHHTPKQHFQMKKHSKNFVRWFQNLYIKGCVFEDGCAICQISKMDRPDFNLQQHLSDVKHLEKLKLYKDTLGNTLEIPKRMKEKSYRQQNERNNKDNKHKWNNYRQPQSQFSNGHFNNSEFYQKRNENNNNQYLPADPVRFENFNNEQSSFAPGYQSNINPYESVERKFDNERKNYKSSNKHSCNDEKERYYYNDREPNNSNTSFTRCNNQGEIQDAMRFREGYRSPNNESSYYNKLNETFEYDAMNVESNNDHTNFENGNFRQNVSRVERWHPSPYDREDNSSYDYNMEERGHSNNEYGSRRVDERTSKYYSGSERNYTDQAGNFQSVELQREHNRFNEHERGPANELDRYNEHQIHQEREKYNEQEAHHKQERYAEREWGHQHHMYKEQHEVNHEYEKDQRWQRHQGRERSHEYRDGKHGKMEERQNYNKYNTQNFSRNRNQNYRNHHKYR